MKTKPGMPRKGRKKRPLRRRALFLLVSLVLSYLCLELLSLFAYQFAMGQGFSFAEVEARQLRAARDATQDKVVDEVDPEIRVEAEEQRIPADKYVRLLKMWRSPHPYLGSVYSPALNRAEFEGYQAKLEVNCFGFVDDKSPLQKRGADRVVIGILGGSVALGFGFDGVDTLSRELKKHPYYREKTIVYVRLGLGGLKQPQQLMAVSYLLSLGAEFDALVNIDGFNEVTLPAVEHLPRRVYPFFPRGWMEIAGGFADPEQLRLLGVKTVHETQRRELARSFLDLPTKYSVTLQLIWTLRDSAKQMDLIAAETALQEYVPAKTPFAAVGPGVDGFTRENISSRLAEHWAQCSIQMGYLAQKNGITYLHFLQPNQYVEGSKPMLADERRIAVNPTGPYTAWAKRGYPELVAQGETIRAAGVDYHDLTMLFSKVEARLYIDDCCHFNKQGNMIMAKRIAEAMLAARDRKTFLDLKAKKLLRLVPTPALVVMHSPFKPGRLYVSGEFADGSWRDLGLASLGCRFEVLEEGIVSVSGDGVLQALANGETKVRVAVGEKRALARVRVDFDPVISFGKGIPGKGGHAPVLETNGRPPRLGDAGFMLEISRALGGATGSLIISPQRIEEGAMLETELPGQQEGIAVPFALQGKAGLAGAGSARVLLPIPDDMAFQGETAYCRARVRDPDSESGWSVSNLLCLSLR